MAFFGFGKKNKKEEKKTEVAKLEARNERATVKQSAGKSAPASASSVLLRPRVTEKTGNLTAAHVYTFDVRTDATKDAIKAAIKAEYKVTPIKVRIVNRKGVRVRLRTRRGYGMTTASKKAYVYVKKGDRIEFAS